MNLANTLIKNLSHSELALIYDVFLDNVLYKISTKNMNHLYQELSRINLTHKTADHLEQVFKELSNNQEVILVGFRKKFKAIIQMEKNSLENCSHETLVQLMQKNSYFFENNNLLLSNIIKELDLIA